ncbi:MAG: Ig-like domain-containing protein [Christensenellales bacterium]
MKKIFIVFIFLLIFACGCQKNDTSSVVSLINVNDIVINKSHIYIDKGDSLVLLAQVFPFNADNQNIIWKSDNEDIASVDGEGLVTGITEGRTVITAESEDGGFTDKCVVYISTPKLNYSNYPNNQISSSNGLPNIKRLAEEDNINYDYDFQEKINNTTDDVSDNNNIIQDDISDSNILKNFEKTQKLFESTMQEFYEQFNEINNIIENTDEQDINYFYEFKYNSQGLNEDDLNEDKFVKYKDEKTLIREYNREIEENNQTIA